MKQYLELLQEVLDSPPRQDRTKVGTTGLFGYQMRFPLVDGFPVLTTKKLHLKSIIHELLWFLSGDTNIKYLQENGVRIWDEWADENGDLGPVYGKQWRKWRGLGFFGDTPQGHVDQISNLIHSLRVDPFGRRHIVSAWNPAEIPNMALPPCHCLFQCYVREATFRERMSHYEGKRIGLLNLTPDEILGKDHKMREAGIPRLVLDLQLYQRSADVFLGVPFNIASYALLQTMLSHVLGMIPGTFIWTGGDTHLYSNHRQQAALQLERKPTTLPKLELTRRVGSIFDFKYEDFNLVGYAPQDHIKAEVAV